MPIWTRGDQGIVLDSQGRVIVCDDCPCEEDPFVNCTDCDTEERMCKDWEFAVAGVSNSACSGCDAVNRTWIISNPNNPGLICTWSSDIISFPLAGAGCIGSNHHWHLSQSFIDFDEIVWRLVFRTNLGFVVADYRLPGELSDFDCDGPNVFNRTAINSNACSGWPATLTLEPVGCPQGSSSSSG